MYSSLKKRVVDRAWKGWRPRHLLLRRGATILLGFISRFRLEPLRKMVQGALSGKALFEAIAAKLSKVDEDIRYPAQAGGCFIKGTRVHTKEGLKPIEEIKVGDWVLSSPEDGSGSPEYKRVVRTFEHDPQPVFNISIHPEGWKPSDRFYFIAATGNHPFWVEGVGWTRADALQRQQWLRLSDGGRAFVGGVQPVYRTDKEGIGWITETASIRGRGEAFDYANYSIIKESEQKKYAYLPEEIFTANDPCLRVNVYNIEVEDFHTYYVGAKGFWVHNANCEAVRLADNKGVAPPVGDPLWQKSKEEAQRNTEKKRACFVAGTLVHTQEGLRPIEQIEVGDYVLSKPESGEGEVGYKRVVRTVKRENCETWLVSWYDENLHQAAAAKRITQQQYLDAHGNSFVITTPDHPFWVVESDKDELFYANIRILEAYRNRSWPCKEWVRADLLAPGMKLMLHDGRIVEILDSVPAYKTDKADQVWTPRGELEPSAAGTLICLENNSVLPEVPLEGRRTMGDEFWVHVKLNPNKSCYEGDPPGTVRSSWYSTTVYDMEVEGYHTYFVDTLGVWVHNTNCYDVSL